MRRLLPSAITLVASATSLLGQDVSLPKVLVPGQGWRVAATGLPGVSFLAAAPDASLEVYRGALSARLRADGRVEQVTPPPGHPVVASPRFVQGPGGMTYQIDPAAKTVLTLEGKSKLPLRLDGLAEPSCLALWPDGGHLVIGEAKGTWLWAVRVEPDGRLGPGDRYYSLRTDPGRPTSVTALTMDAGGLLYACTPQGVQVFDPTGRLAGVVLPPAREQMTAITLGGPGSDTLYVAAGDKVYARKVQGRAVYAGGKEKGSSR
jgi:enterochelin esterase family protein